MAPTTPADHDPAATPASQPQALPPNIPTDIPGLQPGLQLDQQQIMNLLRSLPQLALQYQPPTGIPGINDPGPSSHPRGPPNLEQLSAVAMQAAPVKQQPQPPRPEDGVPEPDGSESPAGAGTTTTSAGGRRSARGATMGTDEWSRLRKDNHVSNFISFLNIYIRLIMNLQKEVERRRRGNINEGINELGRLVPNGSGEKAKGAILSRAVQYIHHLKENEARNIEKWTLEKLLMDQAMGDLQAQLEEVKRRWEEETMLRSRAEAELEALKNMNGISGSTSKEDVSAGTKRRSTDDNEGASKSQATTEGAERDGKRQRTD